MFTSLEYNFLPNPRIHPRIFQATRLTDRLHPLISTVAILISLSPQPGTLQIRQRRLRSERDACQQNSVYSESRWYLQLYTIDKYRLHSKLFWRWRSGLEVGLVDDPHCDER